MNIRMYENGDYKVIDPWFSALAEFYDGHTSDKKLIDQLVDRQVNDPEGFFTLAKEIFICEEYGEILGFFCLNYKRGQAIKLGPLIVSPTARGRGVGKFLFRYIDELCTAKKIRKIYATTSHLNEKVNALFSQNGYRQEALYPDQYKIASNEIIWGKIFIPDTAPGQENNSLLINGDEEVSVRDFDPETDISYLKKCEALYTTWHDDLGDDFIQSTLSGYHRGTTSMDFQAKTKAILVACHGDMIHGMGVLSPKRGGAAKLYPFYGTSNSQQAIIQRVVELKDEYGIRKIYSFCSVLDNNQRASFLKNGFAERGILVQPYKSNTRLVTYDLFI